LKMQDEKKKTTNAKDIVLVEHEDDHRRVP